MTIVCNCPGKCEIHPKQLAPVLGMQKGSATADVTVPPDIDAMDKLTLKTLEAESLKAVIEAQRIQQQAMMRAQSAHQQLEQFTAAMFEKHHMAQSEWMLDLSKLEFVKRV